MKQRRLLAELAFTLGLLAPLASAQKPSAPPSIPPIRPVTPSPSMGQPTQPGMDSVKFLMGRVATSDGTPVPHDILVERICNERVRQQVYVSPNGDFSMEIGSKNDSFLDASGDTPSLGRANNKNQVGGIPLRELAKCELQASGAGFRSARINLAELAPSSGSVDVGAIVVERATKTKDTILSARPYQAPPNARKAYEKGLDAENKGKLAEAHKSFEQAVALYPKYASAWFQLGAVCERQNQKDSARGAYIRATAIDMKFLPPYLSLASMAFEAGDWSNVLQLTRHIMDLDPLTYGNVPGYVLDLNESNSAQAYFFNAVANYKLDRFEEAEKSALKAEHMDLPTKFPKVHVLLADLFARKKDYAVAISELQAYLELVPHAKDADIVRERLANWEKMSLPTPAADKPVQN